MCIFLEYSHSLQDQNGFEPQAGFFEVDTSFLKKLSHQTMMHSKIQL